MFEYEPEFQALLILGTWITIYPILALNFKIKSSDPFYVDEKQNVFISYT